MKRIIIIMLAFVLAIMTAPAVLAEDAVFTAFPGGSAPYCSTRESPCVANSSLLMSRDNIGGQQEPNQPNTIDGCADGGGGIYMGDESWENLTVTEVGGDGVFDPGDTVEVEGWVYCFGVSDRIGFAYTNSSDTPSWTIIYTGQCLVAGFESFSHQFILDSTEGDHAVRGIMQWSSFITTACDGGSYNDHDDLVFYVAAPPPSGGTAPGFEPGLLVVILAVLVAGAVPVVARNRK